MPTFNFHAKSSDLDFLDIQIKFLMIEIMSFNHASIAYWRPKHSGKRYQVMEMHIHLKCIKGTQIQILMLQLIDELSNQHPWHNLSALISAKTFRLNKTKSFKNCFWNKKKKINSSLSSNYIYLVSFFQLYLFAGVNKTLPHGSIFR